MKNDFQIRRDVFEIEARISLVREDLMARGVENASMIRHVGAAIAALDDLEAALTARLRATRLAKLAK